MKEPPSSSDSNRFNRFLVIALLLTISLCVYLFFNNKPQEDSSPNHDHTQVAQGVDRAQEIKKHIKTQITSLESSKKENSNSGIWGNTTDMFLSTLNDYVGNIEHFVAAIDQENTTPSYAPGSIEEHLKSFEAWYIKASKMVEENQVLIRKVKTISSLESKIDSLEVVLSNESRLAIIGKDKEHDLRLELRKYQTQVEQLKEQGRLLKFQYDSMSQELLFRKKSIDSLEKLVNESRMAYQVLENSAEKNSKLATRINLWYFVADKRVKQERRMLTTHSQDYNQGKEIKTIYGEFSLSSEVYVPFKVATVYLYKVERSQNIEIAQVKVTVRDQLSGEFSLIPSTRLAIGKYAIEVHYHQKKVLESQFFIAK